MLFIPYWKFRDLENTPQKNVLKIEIENLKELPIWRKRKNKKPIVMIDKIELYNKEY